MGTDVQLGSGGDKSVVVNAVVDEVVDSDAVVDVDAESGAPTKSERQTPKPGTTLGDLVQFADTHDPARRT